MTGTGDRLSHDWVARLRADGPRRELALSELHALLLRAARFEVGRRARAGAPLRGRDPEDLAQQSADDALVGVLARLADFRGESRFTTWAYKFALYEAAASIRRGAWQGREIPLEAQAWDVLADRAAGPQQGAETRELLSAIREVIDDELTPRRREVLVALALNDVPIDVLAERLGTTRGALYKTLHDARRQLRAALTARGMSLDIDGGREGS